MSVLPAIVEPAGSPAGVRAGAQRLERAATQLRMVADRLAATNETATRSWESTSQRMFTIMATVWVDIARGAAGITDSFTQALVRYASVLDSCQADVRHAQRRMQALMAGTPPGMMPDGATVSSIVGQARAAAATADRAARDLAATAAELIGPVAQAPGPSATNEAGASFVSRSHLLSTELVSTAPSTAFDARAAHLERQLVGALNGMFHLETQPPVTPAGAPQPFGATMTIGGTGPGWSSSAAPSPGFATIGGTGAGFSSSAAPGPGFATIGGTGTGFSPSGPSTSFFSGVVGGPSSGSRSNPVLVIAEAIENQKKRSAEGLWRSVFPGVAPPDTDAAGIRRAILDASSSNPNSLAITGVGILEDGHSNGIRRILLQDGYTLVRRNY